VKRALAFLHLEGAGNTLQTGSTAFHQVAVKAVAAPSVYFRGLLCKSPAAAAELHCPWERVQKGGRDVVGRRADPREQRADTLQQAIPCQITSACSPLVWRWAKHWV